MTIAPAGAATVPGRPTIGIATGGVASVSVSFSAPASNGGSAITAYTATCESSNGGAARSVSRASTPIAVSPLTNGKTYTCTVTATNGVGTSAPSAASNAATVATVPGAPTLVTASSRNLSLRVAFSPPNFDGGVPVTQYNAFCSSSNGGASGSASESSGPIIVNGLTNTKTYTCAVSATNAVGSGGASAASNTAVPAVTVPDPPTITGASAGNTAIAVSFTPPANNGGSSITAYGVSCVSSNGGASGAANLGGSPITVNGLTNGRTYTCAATATSGLGTSTPSSPSTAVVPKTVPGAPSISAVTSRNLSLRLAISPPSSDGGATITRYDATCTSSNGGATGSASASAAPVIVNGLTNGRAYRCSATAANAAGTGPSSGLSGTAVPAVTVPDPPVNVAAFPRNTSLRVTFSPPANNGGSAITGYAATCTSSNGGASSSAAGAAGAIIVDGLTNGRFYTCTVTATSGLGTSAPSTASNGATPGVTVPDPPTVVTATSRNVSLAVSFVPPANNGGSAITAYAATCVSSNGGATGSATGSTNAVIVNGLTNGKSYTCTVTATNALGTSGLSGISNSAVPAATVPDPPMIGSAVPRFSSTRVSFSPPANNGGSAITGYAASCTSSNGGASGSAAGAASPITVGGLTNGATYTCTVTATNALGTGATSAPSNSVVPAATVPDPPTIGAATTRYLGLAVAFTGPSYTGGSAISKYSVSCASSNGGVSGSASGPGSPVIVSGLTNGKAYKCTVTATNAIGTSSASAASNSAAPGVTVSDPPTALTATSRNVSLKVGFAPPANNGGSAVTSYAVSCVSSNGGGAGSASGSSSPIIVNGLTNGKLYTCTATATSALGTGVASAPSNAAIPAVTVPDPPTITNSVGGNTALAVLFTPAANNGGNAISSYAVSCTSSDGGASGSASAGGSPITVNGLSNGHFYTCTVTATNGLGTSTPSAPSSSTFIATVPGAPKIGTVSSRNISLKVAFSAPTNDGGSPVTGYIALCQSSNGGTTGGATGPQSPIIVNGLTNGKSYACKVTATNAVGSGPPSGTSNSAVPAVTVPDPPNIATVTGRDGRLTVAFSAPANDGGSPIIGYDASCMSSDGGAPGVGSDVGSPIVVGQLTNGKTYTCTVTATSGLGTSVPSSPWNGARVATVPDAPGIVVIVVNNHSLLVAFAAPSDDGGSSITRYTAYCVSSDGGVARKHVGTASPILVSSLNNAKHYTCSVTASNAIGASGASTKSRSAIVGAPKSPVAVVASARPTSKLTGSLSVRFTTRSDNGSAVEKFTVYCLSADGGVPGGAVLAGTDATPITVKHLTTGRTYACTATATNARGVSLPAPASLPVTVGAPAPPTAVKAVSAGAGQLSVTFKPGANNGSAVFTYAITCETDGSGATGTATTGASGGTVPNLTAGDSYACTVVAANARGSSAESAPSPPTIA